jgi:hypothetical protein
MLSPDELRRLAEVMENEGEHDLSPCRVGDMLRAIALGDLTLPQMIFEFVPEDHL